MVIMSLKNLVDSLLNSFRNQEYGWTAVELHENLFWGWAGRVCVDLGFRRRCEDAIVAWLDVEAGYWGVDAEKGCGVSSVKMKHRQPTQYELYKSSVMIFFLRFLSFF